MKENEDQPTICPILSAGFLATRGPLVIHYVDSSNGFVFREQLPKCVGNDCAIYNKKTHNCGLANY
jgi:hypothetical protein